MRQSSWPIHRRWTPIIFFLLFTYLRIHLSFIHVKWIWATLVRISPRHIVSHWTGWPLTENEDKPLIILSVLVCGHDTQRHKNAIILINHDGVAKNIAFLCALIYYNIFIIFHGRWLHVRMHYFHFTPIWQNLIIVISITCRIFIELYIDNAQTKCDTYALHFTRSPFHSGQLPAFAKWMHRIASRG